MKLKLLTCLLLLLPLTYASAVNNWCWGKVTLIQTLQSDGSFIIHVDNPGIKNIYQYDRVFFQVSDMGAERTKAALSMALTVLTAGKTWGVVIDLPTTPESTCYTSATASQGAGIQ